MNIGIYDIDLCHNPSPKPNLELMKVYHFHQLAGDKVTLMKPYELPTRFSHVYYFKESALPIPIGLKIRPNNKTTYGEGFYGKFTSLPHPYDKIAPDPYVYLSRFNKYKGIKWEHFVEGSIIRFENQDFTGIKDNPHMFIVDKNFCRLPDADAFWLEVKQKKLHFLYALTIDNIEMFHKFERFSLITPRDFVITFKLTPDLLQEMNNQKIIIGLEPYNQTELTKLFLYMKHNNIKVNLSPFIDLNSYQGILKQWYASRTTDSLYDFCRINNLSFTKQIMNMSDELRLFAKTKVDSTSLDRLDF